jgi:ice-binding like protein/fibronectin type III domain protein
VRETHSPQYPVLRNFCATVIAGALLSFSCVAISAAVTSSPAEGATRTPSVAGSSSPPAGATIVGEASIDDGSGYWTAYSNGTVTAHGTAVFGGDATKRHLSAPVVAIASTSTGHGYWLLTRNGEVLSFGDAKFHGSAATKNSNKPFVAISSAPGSRGYWVIASDGVVLPFGDAHEYGSTAAKSPRSPLVAIVSTPGALGFWVVANSGKVFSFGNAHFYGSPGSPLRTAIVGKTRASDEPSYSPLKSLIVGMARTNNGGGYYLLSHDGQVYAFGDAQVYGSALGTDAIGIIVSGDGYWVESTSGQLAAEGNPDAILTPSTTTTTTPPATTPTTTPSTTTTSTTTTSVTTTSSTTAPTNTTPTASSPPPPPPTGTTTVRTTTTTTTVPTTTTTVPTTTTTVPSTTTTTVPTTTTTVPSTTTTTVPTTTTTVPSITTTTVPTTTTTVGVSFPGPPTDVTAVAGDSSAVISWLPPTSDGNSAIISYRVVAEDVTNPSNGNEQCGTSGATTCMDYYLVAGDSYVFIVNATSVVGIGAASAESNEIEAAALPGAPTDVTAVLTSPSATISWAPANNGDSTLYEFTATAADLTDPLSGGQTCSVTAVDSCTVTGLTRGDAYTFSVAQTNSIGQGPPSSSTNLAVPPVESTSFAGYVLEGADVDSVQTSIAYYGVQAAVALPTLSSDTPSGEGLTTMVNLQGQEPDGNFDALSVQIVEGTSPCDLAGDNICAEVLTEINGTWQDVASAPACSSTFILDTCLTLEPGDSVVIAAGGGSISMTDQTSATTWLPAFVAYDGLTTEAAWGVGPGPGGSTFPAFTPPIGKDIFYNMSVQVGVNGNWETNPFGPAEITAPYQMVDSDGNLLVDPVPIPIDAVGMGQFSLSYTTTTTLPTTTTTVPSTTTTLPTTTTTVPTTTTTLPITTTTLSSTTTTLPTYQTISMLTTATTTLDQSGLYNVGASSNDTGATLAYSVDSVASNTAECTVDASGNVSFTGTGTCTIDVNSAADWAYLQASQGQQVLTVNPAAASPVGLGTAANYAVLGTIVTNGGATVLNGDLGSSSPIAGSAPTVNGYTYVGDSSAVQAQTDLGLAYDAALGLTPTASFVGGDQNGVTFYPGVYNTAAAFALTGTMTLNGGGDPNAVFIFQVEAALNTAADSTIVLINGAKSSNVFWQVLGAANTGAGSSFTGTIMAFGAITLGDGGSVEGRALSLAAITLADNTVTVP